MNDETMPLEPPVTLDAGDGVTVSGHWAQSPENDAAVCELARAAAKHLPEETTEPELVLVIAGTVKVADRYIADEQLENARPVSHPFALETIPGPGTRIVLCDGFDRNPAYGSRGFHRIVMEGGECIQADEREWTQIPVPPTLYQMAKLSGAQSFRAYERGGLHVFLGHEPFGPDGALGWHLSISHPLRYPTWDEQVAAVRHFMPDGARAASYIVPEAEHVNTHARCFHWWECFDSAEAFERRGRFV